MNLIDFAVRTTKEYIDEMPKSQRKKYGQFFTSKETALFMAGLFDVPANKTHLYILDKTTPRLIQFHTLKNAVNPPFLGGFSIFNTVVA